MPAAKPSKSSIQNVLDAMIAAGLEIGEIRVDANGGFTITQKRNVDKAQQGKAKLPRKFGVAGSLT
ncbi:hypothetical protein [Shimia thalassica]|uniref:hypothetical protein n=1 Tax=Shimia thalassica TaxID=1715693 RepID=UPI0026E328D8|nr:hypothetical protein [Shimia thalassica]MDO6799400.1 hypothetical protein [Shimia thalassica]